MIMGLILGLLIVAICGVGIYYGAAGLVAGLTIIAVALGLKKKD